jgi:serine/threonine-protein phosphatase 2B catalytic subunit
MNTSMSIGSSIEFPTVITIFSAPNYCGTYSNKGAYFILDSGALKVKQFNDTPSPYDLPEGYNAFNWSVPFLADRILNMFNNILE